MGRATGARGGKMRAKAAMSMTLMICAAAGLLGIAALRADSLGGARVINIDEDRPDLNFVGQFVNSGADSHQFGYVSRIEGIDNVFNSDTSKDESTAMFTFSTQATNVQVINNGPIRAVNRTGKTTIYYHPEGGASFSDPSTFEAGLPIQVSDYQQQVVLDPSTPFPFTTTHLNTITSTRWFALNGQLLRLGLAHSAYRTHYLGRVNAPGLTPSGWFAGYAVGVSRNW
jgi:hypothetical protein